MTATIHYASYLVNGDEVFGTAEFLNGSGYLFRAEGERKATLVTYKDAALMLLGLVQAAEAQSVADRAAGGYAALACSREEGRQ
jgi:hypothetical protein